ncbi:hypothetical protein [Pedobacter aquatilis]|uniref:hypothetical protein n=1 Tax=Pedobacter aquatilis TaxID=351343 RepID=UPI002930F8FB|nr:hypothetical protein [Pedobacter aquatilis]
MENNILSATIITDAEIAGLILISFGCLTIALAIHRKRIRARMNGLKKFVATDRAAFGKKTESIIQQIGLILFIGGLLTFTLSALYNHQPEANNTLLKLSSENKVYVEKV